MCYNRAGETAARSSNWLNRRLNRSVPADAADPTQSSIPPFSFTSAGARILAPDSQCPGEVVPDSQDEAPYATLSPVDPAAEVAFPSSPLAIPALGTSLTRKRDSVATTATVASSQKQASKRSKLPKGVTAADLQYEDTQPNDLHSDDVAFGGLVAIAGSAERSSGHSQSMLSRTLHSSSLTIRIPSHAGANLPAIRAWPTQAQTF